MKNISFRMIFLNLTFLTSFGVHAENTCSKTWERALVDREINIKEAEKEIETRRKIILENKTKLSSGRFTSDLDRKPLDAEIKSQEIAIDNFEKMIPNLKKTRDEALSHLRGCMRPNMVGEKEVCHNTINLLPEVNTGITVLENLVKDLEEKTALDEAKLAELGNPMKRILNLGADPQKIKAKIAERNDSIKRYKELLNTNKNDKDELMKKFEACYSVNNSSRDKVKELRDVTGSKKLESNSSAEK